VYDKNWFEKSFNNFNNYISLVNYQIFVMFCLERYFHVFLCFPLQFEFVIVTFNILSIKIQGCEQMNSCSSYFVD
jgi:hypothetical protein